MSRLPEDIELKLELTESRAGEDWILYETKIPGVMLTNFDVLYQEGLAKDGRWYVIEAECRAHMTLFEELLIGQTDFFYEIVNRFLKNIEEQE